MCREHLAKASSAAGRYAYFGTVFRFRPGGTSEFAQAGIELIDTPDPINADVQALTFAVTALARLDAPYRQVRLGDKSLFAAIVDAMDIPAGVAAMAASYSRLKAKSPCQKSRLRQAAWNAILGAQLSTLARESVYTLFCMRSK